MTTWSDVLGQEKQKPYFIDMMNYVAGERASGKIIYPPKEQVFSAFKATEFDQVKVVILGQDPYHGPHQAHGLCFSVLPGIKPPPSLANMYKELAQSIPDFEVPQHGFLQSWAKQGVLLLNTVLTVEQGKAHSHAKIGWERFTDNVIQALSQHGEGIVFLLWGSHAKKKGQAIDRHRHYVLTAPHPSPLSAHRGFFGCNHFAKANEILIDDGQKPIDWKLPAEVS
ncbi:uracil-DNA glycosylase [Kangiella marina]|uniref:Uracil-DNA glycosylase n=1 Tax=Kangiella marina TaxID=1079178 RepID=A0ABP8IGH2_9GAMM